MFNDYRSFPGWVRENENYNNISLDIQSLDSRPVWLLSYHIYDYMGNNYPTKGTEREMAEAAEFAGRCKVGKAIACQDPGRKCKCESL
jgi:hypothetical protein